MKWRRTIIIIVQNRTSVEENESHNSSRSDTRYCVVGNKR